MDDPNVRNALLACGPALIIGLLAFALAWWRERGRAAGRLPVDRDQIGGKAAAGPIALGLSSFFAYMLMNRPEGGAFPSVMPSASATSWWPTVTLIATLLGLANALLAPPMAVKHLVRAAALTGIGYAICKTTASNASWDTGSLICVVGGFVALTMVLIGAMEQHARDDRGTAGPLTGVVVAAGASIVAITGFSVQSPAFFAAGLSAAMGAAALVALVRPRLSLAHGAMSTFGTLLGAALLLSVMTGSTGGREWRGLVYLALIGGSAVVPLLVDYINVSPRRVPGFSLIGLDLRGAARVGLALACAIGAMACAKAWMPVYE